MTQIIDGKKISQEIKDELREQVAEQKKLGKEAALAVIQVGTDPASSVYVNNKKKACAYIGIGSLSYELPEETTEEELLALVEKLNGDASVNGILVQLPPGKRWKACDRGAGICLLHTGGNHPALKALRN